MSTKVYINKNTGGIVEETIHGCPCQSYYAKQSDYLLISDNNLDEVNKIINLTESTRMKEQLNYLTELLDKFKNN